MAVLKFQKRRNCFSLLKKLGAIWGNLTLYHPSLSLPKNAFLFPSLWPNREYTWALLWKNLVDLFWKRKKIEELEYLIHYVKFKMWPTLLILCKFPIFWMLVLACTLSPPIYRKIENWDFECCSRLVFTIFPMMREVKNWSFLD